MGYGDVVMYGDGVWRYGCMGYGDMDVALIYNIYMWYSMGVWYIIESVDSISRDEPDSPLTQYIANAGISRARYTITHFKHHHRVLWLISNRMSV